MTQAVVELNDGHMNLTDSSAAEILGSLARCRRPAAVTFTHGDATCRLLTRSGVIYAASGSDPANRIGARVRELASVEPAVLDSILLTSKTSQRPVGALLLEGGHLPPVEVREALRTQLKEAVRDVLTWREGDVELEVSAGGTDEGELHVAVPIRPAVLRGLRLATDVQSLVERMGGTSQPLEPCFEMDEVIDAALGEREFELLRLIDGKRIVDELSRLGPFREAKNLRLIVALWALRLVRPLHARMIRFPDRPPSDPQEQRQDEEDSELEALLRRAMVDYLAGDYRASLSALDRCLEIDPHHRRARHNRDQVRQRIGDR